MKVLFFLLLISALVACQKEDFLTDSTAKIDFSSDTVQFDTVFTTIGTITKTLMVYNKNDEPIKISRVWISNGDKSNFKLVIDGIKSNSLEDLEIGANDSAFIFVSALIDPNNTDNPIVVFDSVLFNLNGTVHNVKLSAWGQDINLIRNSVINTQTWTNAKPYVVYDTVLVDSNQTLTIEPGTKVYFHRNASMIVDGTLRVNGTQTDPVIFKSDRFGKMLTDLSYDEVPGQWGQIWLRNSSTNNKIDYAIIRNGTIGLQVGVLGDDGQASLEITNTKIENHSFSCLYAINANIKAVNCLIDNSGYYCFVGLGVNQVVKGPEAGGTFGVPGNYEFYHCTFANYFLFDAGAPSAMLSDSLYYETEKDTFIFVGDINQANFYNCIFYGEGYNQLVIFEAKNRTFNYQFDHCLVRIDEEVFKPKKIYFPKTTFLGAEEKPIFKSTEEHKLDFSLSKDSYARDRIENGNEAANQYPNDLNGASRLDDGRPDIGAYEYYK